MRILLVNLAMESVQEVARALSGQGYEITADRNLTVEEMLTLSPEVIVTEVTPSDLGNCGLISQIKARSDPRTSKAVLIIHGGALERARALDLGADDVVSFPFEPSEFAAKIRTQFREMQPELELEAKLVEALGGGTNSKRRSWVTLAILGLGAAAVFAVLVSVISTGHNRKDTLQLKAEVARLNSGILRQGELLRRSEQAREFLKTESSAGPGTHESLKAQTED